MRSTIYNKATDAARQANLPEAIMETIEQAPVYGEGRGFRLKTKTKEHLEAIKKLAAIKMAKDFVKNSVQEKIHEEISLLSEERGIG